MPPFARLQNSVAPNGQFGIRQSPDPFGTEADRIAALHTLMVLDTAQEESYDDITCLTARLCDVPIALISLVDEDRQWFKSRVGLDVCETAREFSFCSHAIQQPELFIVPDAAADPRFADNPFVAGDPYIRFYAGVPLVTTEGHALGSLCVIDRQPRILTDEQKAILKMLARQVIDRIELNGRAVLQKQLVAQQEGLLAEKERLIAEHKQTELALRQSEEELQAVVDQAMDGIYVFDPVTKKVLKTNVAFREMLDYSEEQAGSLTLYDIIGHTKASIDCNVNALTAEVKMIVGERQYLRRDGTLLVAEVHAQIIRHKGGQAFCVAVHDVTERRQAEAAQFAAERDYQSLFENASEGIFRTTLDGKYLQANPALARIYGYETPAILIREMTDINTSLYVDAEKRQQFQRLIKEQGRAADFEAQLYRQDGTIIWISESARPVYDAGGELLWYEGFVQDITERKAREDQQAQRLAEAVKRADRDPLTGLLNHRAFQKKLEQETDRMQRQGASLVVAILDLDNFKFFNDAYGHAAGDEVLRQVAEALRQQCRSYDTLSRFGGDEFGLLLPGAYEAEQLAAGLKERLARIGYCPPGYDTPIPIGASIGLAVFPNEAATRTEVLALADERLRRVKSGVGEAEDLIAGLRARLPVSAIEGFEMLTALVTAVDTKDRYTRRHSEDVLSYSLQIAVGLGLSEETRQTIAVAALLHDVGKIGVPDAILRKPGRLTDAEFKAIQQHPVMGAAIVGAVAGFEETLDAVRHHHERWDGGGYPSGLRGEKTPLIARVMAVADAFSAMTTDRPYRNSMTDAKALSILNEGAGSQWDPACVEAFLRSRISRRGILNRSI